MPAAPLLWPSHLAPEGLFEWEFELVQLDEQKLRDRDKEALRALFDYLYPRLIHFVLIRFGPGSDPKYFAEDIAQEALMRVYQNLDRFLDLAEKSPEERTDEGLERVDVESRILAFARNAARNVMAEYFRREARGKLSSPRSEPMRYDAESTEDFARRGEIEEIVDPREPEKQLVSSVVAQEVLSQLEKAAPLLRPVEQEVLRHILKDSDLSTIADDLGLTMSAAYRIKQGLVRRLSRILSTASVGSEPPDQRGAK
jgi:RNA polymerase sigma factor (sigma-70 family)